MFGRLTSRRLECIRGVDSKLDHVWSLVYLGMVRWNTHEIRLQHQHSHPLHTSCRRSYDSSTADHRYMSRYRIPTLTIPTMYHQLFEERSFE